MITSSYQYLKNKKKRPNRRAEVDSEDILPASTDNMDIEEKPIQRRRVVDEDIVDDEDLQAVLAQQRRARLKKIRPQDPEEIARLSESYIICERITVDIGT